METLCTTPLGLPVVPEEYIQKPGSAAVISTGASSAEASDIRQPSSGKSSTASLIMTTSGGLSSWSSIAR